MGLDNFWVNKKEENGTVALENAPVEGEFNVCGGMMTDHGNTSFRGKVYNDLVENCTGISLYQELIPNEIVRKMAAFLSEIRFSKSFGETFYINEKSFNDFVRMFQAHADAGHDLAGWW